MRRTGGGGADLAAASRLLATGRDVIVFPEGTRSRDGRTGDFHRGAARLAAGAARRPRRGLVIVRIGAPVCVMELSERLVRADEVDKDGVTDATAAAHARVMALVADRPVTDQAVADQAARGPRTGWPPRPPRKPLSHGQRPRSSA